MNKQQYVQQPMSFNDAELNLRKEKAKHRYINGYIDNGNWLFPCAEVQNFSSVDECLDALMELAKQGRIRYPIPSVQIPTLFTVYLYKTTEDQEADLVDVYKQVQDDYRKEIEEFNQAQVELLAQQLYENKKRQEQKKQEEKEAKEKAAALAEASEYFATLQNKEKK